MIGFVLRRTLEAIPVLLVVFTVAFFLVRLAPGGPFDSEKRASPQVLQQLESQYRLNEPLYSQYLDYLGGVLHGDFGPSFRKPGRTVSEWIALRFPVSLELGTYALLVALAVGMGAGLLAALRPNSALDHGTMSVAMLGICLPGFVLGPLLVLVFALWLGWLPVMGWSTPMHKSLPSITLGAAYAAGLAVGYWDGLDDLRANWSVARTWTPGMVDGRRNALIGGWRKAVERSYGWA